MGGTHHGRSVPWRRSGETVTLFGNLGGRWMPCWGSRGFAERFNVVEKTFDRGGLGFFEAKRSARDRRVISESWGIQIVRRD